MSEKDRQSAVQQKSRRTFRILFVGLAAWALLIAAGTVLSSDRFDIRKPLIVMGTMGGFLGLWLVALVVKSRRSRMLAPEDKAPGQVHEKPPA